MLGLSNKIRIFKIKRNKETCVGCKKCDRACPMNIVISNKEAITSNKCISCMECTSKNACPIKNTVVVGEKKGRRKQYE